jgi:hypothetical protein
MKYFIEIEIDVEYQHQPFEARQMSYPGCDESIEDVSVMFGNHLITDQIDTKTMDTIINQCWIDVLEKAEGK